MRLPVIIGLVGVLLAFGCGHSPQFTFTDQTSVTFTYRTSGQPVTVTLGASSRSRFIETVQQRESDFDPKMLMTSLPMGSFRAGDVEFEYHLGLIVYRAGDSVHIWRSEFSHNIGDALLKHDDTWKQVLER